MRYNRSIDELEALEGGNAYWPEEISEVVAKESPSALLLSGHEEYRKLLSRKIDSPEDFIEAVLDSALPGNLLLKHSAVLADVGGESVTRMGPRLKTWFPIESLGGAEARFMHFTWREESHDYRFRSSILASDAKKVALSNRKLGLDGPSLISEAPINDLQLDMMMLFFFGGSVVNDDPDAVTALEKCIIGRYLGDQTGLENFMRARYVEVSRITQGAKANSLGNVLQRVVKEKLQTLLGVGYSVRGGKIDGMSFDVVVEKDAYRCGIEVAFQVTTNSTIERKGNEAEGRRQAMHALGHSVAFVLDGAGIFERRSAVTKICESSDCTVRFSDEELDVLAKFIKERAALK